MHGGPELSLPEAAVETDAIRIRGARQHNLKNLDSTCRAAG